ncbi:MAG: fatty acid desaturase [Verrucomicrobiaceae bacterium]|nr:MAG: fatty acid desaturase [Verrucomicrobiaceae bacterium]
MKLPTVAEWKAMVAKFQRPSISRAAWQMINSIVPYAALWALMAWSLKGPYWVTLLLAVLTGLFVVRIFIIFHDCGHGSYFKSRKLNDIAGFITGVITFTPYHHWRWEHSLHHASCGDLERRGVGDIWTMTVKEYCQASPKRKFIYRVARNPVVLFLIAPVVMFMIYQRIPSKKANRREKLSVHWMNAAILLLNGLLIWAVGFKAWCLIQIPITMAAGAAGVWMFYIQHQYEDVYWEHHQEWDYTSAALLGSSFYKLPRILQWFTGNIGFHHIHHLSPRIPNYNLEACHKSHEIFQRIKPITFLPSLKAMHLRLWDEENRQLVGFNFLRRQGLQGN